MRYPMICSWRCSNMIHDFVVRNGPYKRPVSTILPFLWIIVTMLHVYIRCLHPQPYTRMIDREWYPQAMKNPAVHLLFTTKIPTVRNTVVLVSIFWVSYHMVRTIVRSIAILRIYTS